MTKYGISFLDQVAPASKLVGIKSEWLEPSLFDTKEEAEEFYNNMDDEHKEKSSIVDIEVVYIACSSNDKMYTFKTKERAENYLKKLEKYHNYNDFLSIIETLIY
jgi:hypothetical protein